MDQIFTALNTLLGSLDEDGVDRAKGIWYLELMANRERIDEGYPATPWTLGYFIKRYYYRVLLKRYVALSTD